jgi:hypothetical protein
MRKRPAATADHLLPPRLLEQPCLPAIFLSFPSVCSCAPPCLPPRTLPRRSCMRRGVGARLQTRCDLPHPSAQGSYACGLSLELEEIVSSPPLPDCCPIKHMSPPPDPLSQPDSHYCIRGREEERAEGAGVRGGEEYHVCGEDRTSSLAGTRQFPAVLDHPSATLTWSSSSWSWISALTQSPGI